MVEQFAAPDLFFPDPRLRPRPPKRIRPVRETLYWLLAAALFCKVDYLLWGWLCIPIIPFVDAGVLFVGVLAMWALPHFTLRPTRWTWQQRIAVLAICYGAMLCLPATGMAFYARGLAWRLDGKLDSAAILAWAEQYAVSTSQSEESVGIVPREDYPQAIRELSPVGKLWVTVDTQGKTVKIWVSGGGFTYIVYLTVQEGIGRDHPATGIGPDARVEAALHN